MLDVYAKYANKGCACHDGGMGMKKQLKAEDREFLSRVRQAAFANPFSRDRDALDYALAGVERTTPAYECLKRVLALVSARLARLGRDGVGRADALGSDEDRELYEALVLFDVFHCHADALDGLIQAQLRSGDQPAPAPFARSAIGMLADRGLPEEEAIRSFSMFYQMRRAYYFIGAGLVGCSDCMREFRRRLWDNLFTRDILRYERCLWDRMEDFSTLLLGETGTGKGAAAMALGRSGYIPFDAKAGAFAESFTRNFTAINLMQFSESLIESELFGHRKGAFTGAVDHHEGVFARCRPHGAIFLDEIGEVSIPVQIKLLQVLQERTFSPVGSHERLRFRGRVIAATNRSLSDLRRGGRFRADFYYRLCSDVITAPPLRQRLREDEKEWPMLLENAVRRLAGREAPGLAADAERALREQPGMNYGWPGNVRELEQAVRRVLLTGAYEGQAALEAPDPEESFLDAVRGGRMTADALLAGYCLMLHRRHGTYEAVANAAGLDRRTARKYVVHGRDNAARMP